MRKYKSVLIMSVLAAVLTLSTACSTTDETTITAAPGDTPTGDSTPAPTDGTAAPDGTPTPGDDTAVPTDSTAAPTDGTAAPDGTPTPGDDTAVPTDSTAVPTDGTAAPDGETDMTSTDTSETSVKASDQDSTDGQESAKPVPFTYEYPELLMINRNDRSTPLGKLCWAYWEYVSKQLVRIHRVLVDNIPNLEVTFPAVADITEGEDNSIGPVGVVNEESNESSIGTDGYLIGSLDEIQEASIVGIVDDPELSEELQLFAEAFFAYIEAFEDQIRTVGYENLDRSQLPYQYLDDIPYKKEFSEAFIANPDKCVIPSEDEANQYYDDLTTDVERYLEETGGPVTIE